MGARPRLPSGFVTFLFTDMESSTPAWDRFSSAMSLAQERHDEILRAAIARSDGYVFSTAGDGLAAAFDRAEDAVVAAVGAQRALLAEAWPEPLTVRVRMGLHTGEPIERDGDYFGPAVIRAARMMALVDGGRIVCSATTRRAVAERLPPDLVLLPLGSARLKGLLAPEQVFAVGGPGLSETGEALPASSLAWSAPRALSRLIGRQAELHDVVALLTDCWLVTLTGAGGVGKSRLALAITERVHDRFADGVAWVDLAPVTHDDDVAHTVADVLQIHGQPGEGVVSTVTATLRGRRMLIVLDNCEHVRASSGELAAAIGRWCDDVHVLATSRERLGEDGERVVPVEPLATDGERPPALALLRERIANGPLSNHRDVSADEDVDALIEITHRLDGLPLALELAAARCRTLGAAAVAARLEADDGLLADRSRRHGRHQTLEQALLWSYRLLNDQERVVLERLSLFAGHFDLDGAERVAQDAGLARGAVDDALASLVDKSLVARRGRHFRLLHTTRQFAARRLDESSDRPRAQRRHTEHIVDQVRIIHQGLHGPEEATWVDALDTLWPDVRVVMRRALADDDADTAVALTIHLAAEAFYRRPEAFAWIREAVARYSDQPGPHRHELLGAGGWAEWALVDIPAAFALAQPAMALDPAPGTALDFLPEAAAIGAFNFSGQFDRAAEICRRALPVLRRGHDRWSEAGMWANLALTLAISGTAGDEALNAAETAIEVATRIGNPTALGLAYFGQAMAAGLHDEAAAAASCATALAFGEQVRNQWLISVTAVIAVRAHSAGGATETALVEVLRTADELHHTGWRTHAWSVAWGAVPLLAELGRWEAAAVLTGGCHASGIANIGANVLPSELAELSTGHGDSHLSSFYAAGARYSLPELVRIGTGADPLPAHPVDGTVLD